MSAIEVIVHAVRLEADRIHSYELRAADGAPLPAFTAGAHVELSLANGLARSYSLANAPGETARYEIAVNKEAAGRGGSAHMHAQVHVGSRLRISAPRNHFALDEAAPHSVLIAGGIGVTPIRSMVSHLRATHRAWTLLYAGRQRALMAYAQEFEALQAQGHGVRLHVDAEAAGPPDLRALVAGAPAGAHFYCCGPGAMLDAFAEATAGIATERVHVEHFAAAQAPALDGGFAVSLARSGKLLQVPRGASILDVLLDAGVKVPFSCMEGVCASCETRVLAGVPEHRDVVLSPSERAANDRMMVCCSGSKSATLTLDL